MRLFFAGSDASEPYNAILIKNGASNRLESFYSLKAKPFSTIFKNHLLDSGGFVARVKNKIISVQEYAAYINKNGAQFAFNLDTKDLKETLRHQNYLERHTNCYILPVYHADDYTNPKQKYLLDMYAERYPYIGLGGIAGVSFSEDLRLKFYDWVFNRLRDKVRVHGLGITTQRTLEAYPFYSVDSTSWLSFAMFANTKTTPCWRLARVQASTRHYLELADIESKWWVNCEKYITEIWKRKGVVWEDWTPQKSI